MITLYQFDPVWGISLSPFCRKVETYCQLAGVPYTIKTTLPFKGPRGKLPYIHDDENPDQKPIPDSSRIIDYLQNHYDHPLDKNLTVTELATGHLLQQTCENSLYFAIVYSRWIDEDYWPTLRKAVFGDLPPVVRNVLPSIVQRGLRKSLDGHGYGRLDKDEIYALADKDLLAIATELSQHKYAAGDQLSSFDAMLYAFLASIVDVPLDAPYKTTAMHYDSIMDYLARIKAMLPIASPIQP